MKSGKGKRLELKMLAIELAARRWSKDRAQRYLASMASGVDLTNAVAAYEMAMARMSRVSR